MKRPAPYACDVCGVEKRETNHWFVVLLDIPTVFDDPSIYENPTQARSIYSVYKWDLELADLPDAKHICGSECLAQLQSKIISDLQKAKDVFPKEEVLNKSLEDDRS